MASGRRTRGGVVPHDAPEPLLRSPDRLAVGTRRIHLTGQRDLASLIRAHAIDSLAPAPHLPSTGLVVDVGSGAGFPGIVLGCLRPDLQFVLIESRRRRASFLREAIRAIPLPAARALEMRAEEAAADPEQAGRAPIAISRALRLDVFLGLAGPVLAPARAAIAMQTARPGGPASSPA